MAQGICNNGKPLKMSHVIQQMLAEKGWLLADGATGTNLFNMGLEAGEAPELWNTDAPDKIRTLYKGAVDAGSDLFLTNSFGANRSRLNLHNAGDRARELSRVAAELAREVADASGRRVLVAGSVGPTGEIMAPVGTLSEADATEMFHEQMDGLKEGGADLVWIETISAPEEYRAAARAADLADIAWCGTMSFDTAGRTMMGVTASDMVALAQSLDPAPMGFGANCGVGASDLLRTVLGFAASGATLPLIAKGNAGIPKFVHGHIHYDGTPELMAEYAVMARNCGASVIGGCCGTTPEHLRAMRAALEETPVGPAPSLDDIQATLGEFSSASDGTGADAQAQRPDRRRRRARA